VSSYERLLAFRRTLPRTPRLDRQTVRARGISFAVFSTPPVDGAVPVLAINGGMLFGHDMLWPALAPLATGRQLILYDQRGRGESSAPDVPASASIADDAADIGALRRALGIRQWDIVGHSWGGGVAMLAAAHDPAGTRRVVTMDAVGPTSDWMPLLRQAALQRLQGDERTALEEIDEQSLTVPDPRIHAAQARAIYPAWFADPSLASRFSLPQVLSPTGAAVLARLRGGYDWRPQLRAVGAPLLVIHGDADPLPVDAPHLTVATIPGARMLLVPRAGHMPFWEAPDIVFPAIEAFLTSPVPAAVPLP
jgi:proline iminopeptidase